MPAPPSYRHLPANADTVRWGCFSTTLTPRVEIDSAGIVTIETLTHPAADDLERMVQGDQGAESVYLWTTDRKGVDRRGAGSTDPAVCKVGSGDGRGVHILTGPVHGRGAKPGDVLELRILDCVPRPGANPDFAGKSFGSNAAAWWGYHYNDMPGGSKREVITIYRVDATGDKSRAKAVCNFRWGPQTDPFRVTRPTIDYPGGPVDHALTDFTFNVLKGIRIPIRPYFGTLGVAPAEADFVDSVPPSHTGGNVDKWPIGKGAIMYSPVSVEGALLSVGVDFGITPVADGNWGVHAIVPCHRKEGHLLGPRLIGARPPPFRTMARHGGGLRRVRLPQGCPRDMADILGRPRNAPAVPVADAGPAVPADRQARPCPPDCSPVPKARRRTERSVPGGRGTRHAAHPPQGPCQSPESFIKASG
ncbi:acetamidase/formamidase family protein [Rhodovulum visakhapatnamense]|uniref:acetamidase/formamidase family protein n=1 Tax=Rhodovulum visakhapatnamense TaxID=364297 RepID=UPI001FBB7EF0|nr:acetamidase/formamidase family protein [Rhodovulum visakhapatnamense]